MDIRDQIADPNAPYDLSLDLDDGDELLADAPYPQLTVEDVYTAEPDRIVWQQLTVTATDEMTKRSQRFVIGRTVAVFDGKSACPKCGGTAVRPRVPGLDCSEPLQICAKCSTFLQREPDREVEIGERIVLPAAVVEDEVDTSHCTRCTAPIFDGAFKMVDDQVLCRGCAADEE